MFKLHRKLIEDPFFLPSGVKVMRATPTPDFPVIESVHLPHEDDVTCEVYSNFTSILVEVLIISFVVNCDLQSNQVQHASHEFPPSHVPMVIPVPPLGVKVILADSELDDKSVSIRSI